MSREWYPWFPHRFWTSERVALMDDAAVALYKFLLDHEWENGPFSSDERVLRAICSRFKSFETSWPQVQPCFRKGRQGKYFNERMEQERELERQAAHARAERSKNSWTKRRDAFEGRPNALAEHVQRNRSTRAEEEESSQPATDGRTDGPTDGRTDLPTYGGAGGPAPGEPTPRRRSRARKVLEPGPGPDTVPIPPSIDTPEFRPLWAEWIEHRKRNDPMTARAAELALMELERWGPARAAPALVNSLQHPKWTSIYEAKNGSTPDGNRSTGNPKHARRPDGTRQGECPEPDVMPRRA